MHPYSTVNAFGEGNEVLIAASLVSVPTANSVLFAIGSGSGPKVLGLFSGGGDEVFVGEIATAGANTLTRLVTATVPGATSTLHHYAVAYDKSTHELAFFVDGAMVEDANAGTPTVEPSAGLQLGSIYASANAGGAVRTGGVIFEDFAVYRQIPGADEIRAMAAKFAPCQLPPMLSGSGVVDWSTGNWSVSPAPQSGDLLIRADGELTLNVDLAVTPGTITFIPAVATMLTLAIADGGSMTATKFDVRAPLKLTVEGAGSLPFAGMIGNGEITLDIGADATTTMAGNNINYTGNLVLRRGRFKMGHSNAFGVNSNAHTVKVEREATLDFNGRSDFIFPIVFNGGTVANTGVATLSSKIQFANVTFAGDGTVEAASDLYSIASQWGSFAYALNGHTLAKTGAGTYCICTGNYTGTGVFDIREGTLTVDAGTVAAGADLSFRVAADATLQFATNRYQSQARSLTVNGTIRLGGSGRVLGGAIAGAWTLRPDGSGYLVFGDAPAAATDGALEIPVDLSAIDFSDRQLRQVPLFKVEAAELLPANVSFTGLEMLPSVWRVVKTAGGLGYKIGKSGLSVIVR